MFHVNVHVSFSGSIFFASIFTVTPLKTNMTIEKTANLKMYPRLKVAIFHCHLSFWRVYIYSLSNMLGFRMKIHGSSWKKQDDVALN